MHKRYTFRPLLFALFSIGLLIACTAVPPAPPSSPTALAPPATAAPASSPTALVPSATTAPLTPAPSSGIQRRVYSANGSYLQIELLDDDLLHFEFASGTPPDADRPIATTPMVANKDYPGPARFADDGQGTLRSAALQLAIDATTLCITISDSTRPPAPALTTLCPQDLSAERKTLTLAPSSMTHVYGLGARFLTPNSPNGDWNGQVITPGNASGNALNSFNGGNVGNAQFPIMYALGAAGENYALFLDNVYAQTWDFRNNPWAVQTAGSALRGYFLAGPDLPDLRSDYLELVGRPLVPPKKMFGLWVSEYGYDNWAELEERLRTLRAANFPIDGFVMDLPWFGGVRPPSHMGALSWDTKAFPEPEQQIARLRDEEGIGLMLIEESYIVERRPEHQDMAARGFLPRQGDASGAPVLLLGWWGQGSMIDWSNAAAGDYWHDLKRQPLVAMGVLGHWTDLGEPELFYFRGWYHGFPELGLHSHRDIHNLYNFQWLESIYRGYQRNNVVQRPFMLSRSGTAGIQRFGVGMWSGDIGANLSSLATHFNAQMHMSFSGIDYFGSDIGGFYRRALDGDLDELYTRWFANGMLLDIPARPHTDNQCNCHATAPDQIGDLASNLANVRLRYRLLPYLYTLAHRAYRFGEPVVPPLVFYYQNDPNLHEMGDQKLLGRDLLVATVSSYNQTQRDVYLPAGTWVNYHTQEWFNSTGEWLRDVPLEQEGVFTLPLFARAGAIIPQMHVDEQTMNALGQRRDGSTRDELVLRIYAAEQASSFTLYEDDGATTAYQQGAVRSTEISQQRQGQQVTVRVEAASGTYAGAATRRDTVLELAVNAAQAAAVTLNGSPLPQHRDQAAFEAASQGWYQTANGLILVRAGTLDVSTAKEFVVTLAQP